MDPQNLSDLQHLLPDHPGLRLFIPGTAVPDPYYTGDFDAALDLIEQGCRALLADL